MPRRREAESGRPSNAAEAFRRQLPLLAAVIEKAAERQGCAACNAVEDVEAKLIFTFLYEGMSMPAAREQFVRGGGFCPRHFRVALEQTRAAGYVGPYEIASACLSLVNRAAEEMRDEAAAPHDGRWSPGRKRRAVAPVPSGQGCIFCREMRDREKDLVLALEPLTSEAKLRERVEGAGLCQRHANFALQTWKEPRQRQWLKGAIQKQIAELQTSLTDFLSSFDHNRREAGAVADPQAPEQALEFLLGAEAPARRKKAG